LGHVRSRGSNHEGLVLRFAWVCTVEVSDASD
jgi:hypothetical protein